MMTVIEAQVVALEQETSTIRKIVLAPASGQTLPAFTAGAHIDVHVAQGIVRQYSLCNIVAHAGHYVIAVKKEATSRGGSAWLHDGLAVGDRITIGEPRNHFGLAPGAAHHVLIAAGIGVTPIYAMAQHLLDTGESFELHYFSRSLEDAAFKAELTHAAFSGKTHFHYGLTPESVADRLGRILGERRAGAHLYFCGPGAFMQAVQQAGAGQWPAETLHHEYFSAPVVVVPAANDRAFKIRLAQTGGEYEIGPTDTIVSVLADNEIYIDTSCEQGVCGTCVIGMIEGEAEHRDVFLTDAEKAANEKIVTCVSRARGCRLVLDL